MTKIPLLDYPEFNDTFDELFDKLLNESGRGAILIGTAYIEEYLEKFILNILPSKDKKYTSHLFNYPGPLSSFSAKLELSYAFRLISKRTFDSLNALRKIRNKAAHTSNEFNIAEVDLNQIFNLGEGMITVVQESSVKLMLELKIESFKSTLQKYGMNKEDIDKYISEKFLEKKNIEVLESQIPHWQLIIGIAMICGILRFYSDITVQKIKKHDTWSSIITKDSN